MTDLLEIKYEFQVASKMDWLLQCFDDGLFLKSVVF